MKSISKSCIWLLHKLSMMKIGLWSPICLPLAKTSNVIIIIMNSWSQWNEAHETIDQTTETHYLLVVS